MGGKTTPQAASTAAPWGSYTRHATALERSTSTGRFDRVELVDGSGAKHMVERIYSTTNNNVAAAHYRRTLPNGIITDDYISMGAATDISDPNYIKVDGCLIAPSGSDIIIYMTGHEIREGSPNRVAGSVWAMETFAGVWSPLSGSATAIPKPVIPAGQQSFSDVGPENVFYAPIERLHAAGIISGYSDGTFRPGNNLTRSQLAKILDAALWPASNSRVQSASKKGK